jgi:putative transposase
VQVRYRYRIYPSPSQQQALARAFGCARVVFNDCLRLRDGCHAAGEMVSDSEVQRRVITLAKRAIHDAGWSQLLRLIEEKAERPGRLFRRIGRFEPTSQVCPACGAKDGPKPLGVRTWACGACGVVHDRDVNAARNILAAGRADKPNACGGGVRPPLAVAAASETGIHRSAA